MEKISEMIERLCPEGVDWIELNNLCKTITPPLKLKTNQYLEEGPYLVIDQGQNYFAGYTDIQEALLPEGEYVLYGDHTCSVKFIDKRFAQGADGLKILKATVSCLPKYLYYALLTYNLQNTEYKRHWTQAKEILIPLPPLPIQQEIVRILDSFTSLITNLETELASRQKQYEYYRKELLTFDENDGSVEWKTLDTLSSISTGNKPSEILNEGSFKYINAGTSESGYCDTYNTEGDMVTTPSRGQGGIGYVGYQLEKFWCGPLCYRIKTNETCLAKFLYYYLSCHNELILQFKCEGGTPALNRKDLMTIEIVVPTLQRQREIVSTLDTFESLITNIKQELEARKKQYEYYREQLLAF